MNVQKWVPSGLMDVSFCLENWKLGKKFKKLQGVPQPQDRRVEALEEAMSTSNTAAQNNNVS